MSRTLFVGFDTSNYTTSAAVCDGSGRVICNSRILLPVREGERGLRQSDAVFHHVRNLPQVLSDVREAVKGGTVLAVGCSVSPAGQRIPICPASSPVWRRRKRLRRR